MKMLGIVVLGVTLFIGLPWLVMGNDFFLYQYFAPRKEAVRRQVFEQTKSYTEGMNQELSNMQFQYEQAVPEHRAALRSIILRRVADFDIEQLSPYLRAFIERLRREQ